MSGIKEGFDKNGAPNSTRFNQYGKKDVFVGYHRWDNAPVASNDGINTELPIGTIYRINGLPHDKKTKEISEEARKKPVSIWLHGGPGLGESPGHLGYANPDFWAHVVYSQRGSRMTDNYYHPEHNPTGFSIDRSSFLESLHNNNTAQLVEDLESLRCHLKNDLGLNADKILVAGGSWGTALAVEYAKKYPQHILGLALTGFFMGEEQSISRGFGQGLKDHPNEIVRKAYENQVILAIQNASNGEAIRRVWENGDTPDYTDLAKAYLEMLSDFKNPSLRLQAFKCRMTLDFILDGAYEEEEGCELSDPERFLYNPKNYELCTWQARKVLSEIIKMHYMSNSFWLDRKQGVLEGIESLSSFLENDTPVYINRAANDPFLPPWVTSDFLEGAIPNASVLNHINGVHHAPSDIILSIAHVQRDLCGSSEKPSKHIEQGYAAIFNDVSGFNQEMREFLDKNNKPQTALSLGFKK